mgnify:CR=1 FL=1
MLATRNIRVWIFAALLSLNGASQAFVATTQNASVSDSVTQSGLRWDYGYSVTNTSTCLGNCGDTIQGVPVTDLMRLVSFVVPYFDDYMLGSITAPAGWSYTLNPADLFGFGAQAHALEWSANTLADGIDMGNTLSGFGFSADYSAGYGPFQGGLGMGTPFFGDPAIPASPMAQAAGIQPFQSTVPEPTSIALILLGGLACVSVMSRKARRLAG